MIWGQNAQGFKADAECPFHGLGETQESVVKLIVEEERSFRRKTFKHCGEEIAEDSIEV